MVGYRDVFNGNGRPRTRVRIRAEIAKGRRAGDVFLPDKLVAKLKRFRAEVDVVTMTATPIPRTLQLGMLGLRDLSIIDTPPVDRLAIRPQLDRRNDADLFGQGCCFQIVGTNQEEVCQRGAENIERVDPRIDRGIEVAPEFVADEVADTSSLAPDLRRRHRADGCESFIEEFGDLVLRGG